MQHLTRRPRGVDHGSIRINCLDLATGTATLVKSVNQPEGATGSAQTTKNGDLFVGWGGLSYFSEFSSSGKLLFNAKLPDGVGTYRAYRLPWNPGR